MCQCQQCSCKLVVTGLEELGQEQSFMRKHPEVHAALGSSNMAGGKLEESFIVLDPSKHPRAGPQGAECPSCRAFGPNNTAESASTCKITPNMSQHHP